MFKKAGFILSVTLIFLFTALTSMAAVQLDSMDELTERHNGSGLMLRGDDTFEGSGMIETRASDLLLLAVNFDPIDISEYAEDGGLHFWMYIYDADALNGDGQIELTSSGTCDYEETHWSIYDVAYDDGWNEVFLPFYECSADELNYSAVNYFRMYNFINYDNFIVIDDISVGYREDFPTLDEKKPAATETPSDDGDDADDESNEGDDVDDEGDGAIEDKVGDDDEPSGNDNRIYVGVIVFSALIVLVTAIVVFTRKYDEVSGGDSEKKDKDEGEGK